ncbi:MAG: hypothetical protein V7668_10675 [Cereibacter changlensis]
MFNDWKKEKAVQAWIDAAQAVVDRLETSKPHVIDGLAAEAQLWAARYRAEGQELLEIAGWTPAERARFISKAETKIAALRKQRAHDSSDGLAVWLHSALALTEPRVAPAARSLWQMLSGAGDNARTMLAEKLAEADLPPEPDLRRPEGF